MKPPAFQFYADDFIGGTFTMTNEERGLYIMLLALQWTQEGVSEDDLMRMSGSLPSSSVARVRCKFQPGDDGKLRNVRLESERAKQLDWRDKQRLAGIASGASRREHSLNRRSTSVEPNTQPNANQTPTKTNSPLSALHSPTPKEEEEPSAPVVPASKKPDGYHADAITVLHILNEATGRHYRETDGNLAVISARLKEPDVDLAGVRKMVARQCALWKDGEMSEYLRPETLFNKTKFDSYYAGRDASIQTNQPHANTRPNPTKPHRNDFIAGANTGPSTTEILRRRAEREARERISAAAGPVASQMAQVESVPPDDSGSL